MVLAVGGEALHTRIKKLRKSLDLTQQKFADALGIKQTTVASYEIGRIVPSDSTIKLICREFDVNEDWLRTGEGNMFISQTEKEKITAFLADVFADEEKPYKKQLILALADLSDDGWKGIEELINAIIKAKK